MTRTSPRDRAFLERLHEVVTRRQQQAARAGVKPAEKARWDIDGSVVIGRIDTAERRVYIGTQHIATPDDGVLVEDQHAPDVRRLWHHTSAMHPDEVLLKRRLQVDGWRISEVETVFDFRTPAHTDPEDRDEEVPESPPPAPPSVDAAAEPLAPAAPEPEPEVVVMPEPEVLLVPRHEPDAADVRLAAAAPRLAAMEDGRAQIAGLLRAAVTAVAEGRAVADDTVSAVQEWNDDLAALAVGIGLPATAGLAEVRAAVDAAVARESERRRGELADAMTLLDGLIDRFPFAADRLRDARAAMTAEYDSAVAPLG